ncbi:MAG: TetR/AcrR family transcriptional regulator [Spirochaetes bacterium]|nr:TetR/AcrR family transcriptional regulator [Spirochaetota bacterium]
MGPKITFTENEIIESALIVLREKGERALTARNIAQQMNGSTQPIYRIFKTMEELKAVLADRIENLAFEYMSKDYDTKHNFLSIGIGFYKFSKDEPELFKFFYLTGRKKFFSIIENSHSEILIQRMQKSTNLKKLEVDTLKTLLRDMAIYCNGLCVMNITRQENISEETFIRLLVEAGHKLITYELLKKGETIDDELFMRFKNNNSNS